MRSVCRFQDLRYPVILAPLSVRELKAGERAVLVHDMCVALGGPCSQGPVCRGAKAGKVKLDHDCDLLASLHLHWLHLVRAIHE